MSDKPSEVEQAWHAGYDQGMKEASASDALLLSECDLATARNHCTAIADALKAIYNLIGEDRIVRQAYLPVESLVDDYAGIYYQDDEDNDYQA